MAIDYFKEIKSKGNESESTFKIEGEMISKTRVRVLRIISRMNVGGPAIQITGLMNNLPKAEFEQVLLYGYCGPYELDYLDEHSIKVECIRLEGFGRSINLLSDFKVFLKIRKVIRAFEPDIIHTHTAKAGFLGRLAALTSMKQQISVHTFHGHLLRGYFSPAKTRLLVGAERFLAKFTDSLVSVGSQVRDELLARKIGNKEKYEVIGPGLEIGDLPSRKSALQTFGIPDGKFNVTWIGRAVPVKSPHRVIEIAKECQEKGLQAQFILVGDGPLLEDVKDIAKNFELPMIFLGWQSDIERILSFSDVVVLTSENEGTPVSLIQAQMAGIPVLTTDVGSASEVMIHDESGYCLTYSAQEFANKIEILEKDTVLRNSFGAAGKRNAQKYFSLGRLANDHAELYRNLVNQSNS